MTKRIFNFCAGPCTLPLEVLEEVQAELLDFQNSGMSVIEISHRSKRFEALHFETLSLAKELSGVPDEFEPLLLSAGAHQQFVMTAMNLLSEGGIAAFVNTGVWANKAFKEAQRIGDTVEIWNGENSNFSTLPTEKLTAPENTKYIHITTNETIGGIQFRNLPEANAPFVLDVSSDYFAAQNIDWSRALIVYGGVQKNLAPSGLTLVFIRKDLLIERKIPQFLSYKAHADAQSLYNTPPTFQIYVLGKVLKWMRNLGGISHFAALSERKSGLLYDFIDNSSFYQNSILPKFRSRTNVIFNTPNEILDTKFWKSAELKGLNGLKGHKIRGGLRASLYNALDLCAVEALINFMDEFQRENE